MARLVHSRLIGPVERKCAEVLVQLGGLSTQTDGLATWPRAHAEDLGALAECAAAMEHTTSGRQPKVSVSVLAPPPTACTSGTMYSAARANMPEGELTVEAQCAMRPVTSGTGAHSKVVGCAVTRSSDGMPVGHIATVHDARRAAGDILCTLCVSHAFVDEGTIVHIEDVDGGGDTPFVISQIVWPAEVDERAIEHLRAYNARLETVSVPLNLYMRLLQAGDPHELLRDARAHFARFCKGNPVLQAIVAHRAHHGVCAGDGHLAS